MNPYQISLNTIINDDPTLKFFLREARLDLSFIDHQVNLMGAALLVALDKWIDHNFY